IAFVEGLMSDEPIPGGDVYVVPAGGGEAKNVTPNMKAQASWVGWVPGSDRVLMAQYKEGRSGIGRGGAGRGGGRPRWSGDESIGADMPGFALTVSMSADGKATAQVRESFAAPPEVWAGPVGEWKQLTHGNAKRERMWGEAKSVHWTSDELTAQGWLIYP